MKKIIFISIITIVSYSVLVAQETVTANVSKTGNKTVIDTNKNYVLLYDEPINGSITFKDRTFAKAKLNIDLLRNEILFLNDNNTLIPLKDQNLVSYVSIGKDFFFNTSKGIIQVIANMNNVKIGIVRMFKTDKTETTGAYGMPNTTSSTTQYSSFFTSSEGKSTPTLAQLSVNQKIDLNYTEQFYLIDKEKYHQILNVKPFCKVFKINKKELENYVQHENLDLKKREDVLTLFNYCTSKL